MSVFRLRTLGGLSLQRDDATLDAVGGQRKTLALLALLAVSGSGGISRDRIAAYLWPEADTERARGALKQTLHIARRHLGSPEAIQGRSELRLNRAYIETDVGAFLRALDSDQPELAANLYGGPFLEGFHLPGAAEFEEWASTQRDALAARYTSVLERLAGGAEDRGEVEVAIGWLRRLQAADPLSGRATLRLMHALDAAGERGAALRCAKVHEALLHYELGSPPDPDVVAFAAHLREEPARERQTADSIPVQPSNSVPGEVAEPASNSAPPERQQPSSSVLVEGARTVPGPSYKAFSAVAVAAFALLIGFLLAGRGDVERALRSGVAEEPSVAVLPFQNVSGDSGIQYLTDGLTEELTSALGRIDAIRVTPRPVAASAVQRRGLTRAEIADLLGVASVVEGTIDRSADRLAIRVRLLNPRDEVVLWEERYDRAPYDVAGVAAEIARGTIAALYPEEAGADISLAGVNSSDPVAYDLYLRARHSWRQRTREELQQAVVYYEGAIERDPTFAMAYAGLADAYVNLSNFGYREGGEAIARARVAAERGRALAPELAETNASVGFVLASQHDFAASEAAFRRAVELNPDYAWAHHYYTLLLLMLGRTDEALEQNRHALAADPLSLPANATRGIVLLQRGELAAADRELSRALALAPGFQLTLYYLGVTRGAQGRYEEADTLLERAARRSPHFTGVAGARAFVLQRTGRGSAARSLTRALEAQAATGDDRARMNLALLHAALGHMDTAFGLFDALAWDIPAVVELRANPLLGPMRSDPRYLALLRKIGVAP